MHVPVDLPQIDDGAQDREAQWEKRATVLVRNPQFGAGSSPGLSGCGQGSLASNGSRGRSRSSSRGPIDDANGDVCASWVLNVLGLTWCRLISKRRFAFMRMGVGYGITMQECRTVANCYRARNIDKDVWQIGRPEWRQ